MRSTPVPLRPVTMPHRLELFGLPRLIDTRRDDVVLTGIPVAILGFLHVVDRPVSRVDLATLFWPLKLDTSARHGLRQALHRIRTALGEDVLFGEDSVHAEDADIESDYDAFTRAIVAQDLEAALELRRGPFLEDFSRPDGWELEAWIDGERDRLDGMLADATVAQAASPSTEIPVSTRLEIVRSVRLHLPWDQKLQATEVRLLTALGRSAEATALIPPGDERSPSVDWEELEDQAVNAGPSPGAMALPEVGVVAADVRAGVNPEEMRFGVTADFGSRKAARSGWRSRRAFVLTAIALAVVLVATRIGIQGSTPSVAGADSGVFLPQPEAWTIFFCSTRATEEPGQAQLYRMAADGSDKHRITDRAGCQQVWMPDAGVLLAELEVSPGGPRVPHRLVPNASNPEAEWTATPIPGGTGLEQIAFGRERLGQISGTRAVFSARKGGGDSDIYLYDAIADTIVPIAQNSADEWDPWIDEDQVYFSSRRTGAGDIYRWSLADETLVRVTDHPLEEAASRTWGDSLFFTRGSGVGDEDGNLEILVRDEAGALTALTDNSWNDHMFHLSPDGRLLCWTSERNGHYEADLMVMDLATGRSRVEVAAPGRDDHCNWAADSSGLLFMTWRDGDVEIYWKALDGGVANLSRYPEYDDVQGVVPGRLVGG